MNSRNIYITYKRVLAKQITISSNRISKGLTMFDDENKERGLSENEIEQKRFNDIDEEVQEDYFKTPIFFLFLFGQWPRKNASQIFQFFYGIYRSFVSKTIFFIANFYIRFFH